MRMRTETFLSSHEVADILGVSTQTLYNWLRQGRVPEPKRNPITNYRLWTPKDVDQIRLIVTSRRP